MIDTNGHQLFRTTTITNVTANGRTWSINDGGTFDTYASLREHLNAYYADAPAHVVTSEFTGPGGNRVEKFVWEYVNTLGHRCSDVIYVQH
jgi:hypothetical protein